MLLLMVVWPGLTPVAAQVPAEGEVRAVIAFIRFADDQIRREGCVTRARREWSRPDRLPAVAHHILSPSASPPFADSSLTAYFYQQSEGRLILYGESYPRLIVTERGERHYRTGNGRVLDRGALTREILRRMEADPEFDLSRFDGDGDGDVDYLFVIPRRLNHLELVAGGAPAVSGLGARTGRGRTGSEDRPAARRGSYVIYRSAGIIIPQIDLLRLMAHEFGHDLWRTSPIGYGHIPFIGGDGGIPGNGSRRLGYALMVGRLSTARGRDVIDTRGDMTISAFERDILDAGWIDCPVLSQSGRVTLGDLYTTSDCRRLIVPTRSARNRRSVERTIYLSNRQRVGYFDRLQFNPCQSSFHGLMTTGLLVHVAQDHRLAVAAADGSLELSIDTSAYQGDLYRPLSVVQLTPWTRPNVNGYTTYPPGFVMTEANWQALDNIRIERGEVSFDYVRDAREQPVIREDSWMGEETSGATFGRDIVISDGATLTVTGGATIGLDRRARIVVQDGASLVVERGARIELGPGSTIEARGRVVLPNDGPSPIIESEVGRAGPRGADQFAVLVFTRAEGYRHDSIPAARRAIADLGRRHGFQADTMEDAAAFTDDLLAAYDAVVFVNTSGDALSDDEQKALERFIKSGGGFAGVHGASATEYDWEWYGRLVGAFFDDHPDVQKAAVHVADFSHPSIRHLPERWERVDEWYDFRMNPAKNVRVLARLDESTYEGGTMGDDHPIVWCQEFDGGRSWYTAMGHTEESYSDPIFLEHLYYGIAYAAGAVDADCSLRSLD